MNDEERKFFEGIFNDKINSKEDINNLLRKNYDKNFPLTNINQLNFIRDEYDFSYNYQRFDSNLSYNNFEEKFYDLNNFY